MLRVNRRLSVLLRQTAGSGVWTPRWRESRLALARRSCAASTSSGRAGQAADGAVNAGGDASAARTPASESSAAVLEIGGVEARIHEPRRQELVPRTGGSGVGVRSELTQETLGHLRWMMQKDALGQDMFLVGPPGPDRRRLAMLYCELTGREVEVVSISRDTTESDLKQRREISGGSALFVDQVRHLWLVVECGMMWANKYLTCVVWWAPFVLWLTLGWDRLGCVGVVCVVYGWCCVLLAPGACACGGSWKDLGD